MASETQSWEETIKKDDELVLDYLSSNIEKRTGYNERKNYLEIFLESLVIGDLHNRDGVDEIDVNNPDLYFSLDHYIVQLPESKEYLVDVLKKYGLGGAAEGIEKHAGIPDWIKELHEPAPAIQEVADYDPDEYRRED